MAHFHLNYGNQSPLLKRDVLHPLLAIRQSQPVPRREMRAIKLTRRGGQILLYQRAPLQIQDCRLPGLLYQLTVISLGIGKYLPLDMIEIRWQVGSMFLQDRGDGLSIVG